MGGWLSLASSERNETGRCQADELLATPRLHHYAAPAAAAEAHPFRRQPFLQRQKAVAAADAKEQPLSCGRQHPTVGRRLQQRRRRTATVAAAGGFVNGNGGSVIGPSTPPLLWQCCRLLSTPKMLILLRAKGAICVIWNELSFSC